MVAHAEHVHPRARRVRGVQAWDVKDLSWDERPQSSCAVAKRKRGIRTCGEDGGDYWCRVQFAFGHAQETADVFAVLKHSRINDRIGDRLGCATVL